MDIKVKLAELREKQQQLSRDYDAVLKEYESSDLVNENRALKKDAEECRRELTKIKEELAGNIRENERLRLALQEQIFNERLNILKVSSQKLQTYFEDKNSTYQNSLSELETKTKEQLAKLTEKARKQLAQDQTEISVKIAELTAELERQLQYQAEEFRKAEESLWQDAKNRLDEMGGEELPPEVVQKRIKQNQIEMKIGLEWVNRIGILLILFGVGAAFQYSFAHWMNDYLKAISFFVLGGVFLLVGEWCYRRRKEVFAKGLIGGGVAILYGSIFYSYFILHQIITLELAMGLSVLVTLTTVVLSLRYNSKTICSIGLIGGFLPFFSYTANFGLSGSGFVISMGYLFLLNLTVLLVSFWKRWIEANYISFLLNIPALIYLVFSVPDWRMGLVYTIGTFLMYLTVTLAYPMLYKISLKSLDVILVGLNTSASSLIVFILLQKENLMQYRGLAALLFGLAYLGLGWFIQKVLTKEKGTLILFYSAALTFAVLAIPFQFGVKWLALGWLVEAVLLMVYGFRIGVKPMETAGWGIFGLCLGAFGLCDFLPVLLGGNVPFFDFKYFVVTAGELTITAYYLLQINRNRIPRCGSRGGNVMLFKNFSLISLLIYFVFTFTKYFDQWAPSALKSGFYYCIFLALILIGLGYGLSKVKIIADGFVRGFSIFLYLAGDIICVGLNLLFPVWTSFAENDAAQYWALGILIVYNLFVFFNVRDLFVKYIRKNNGNYEMVPLLLAIFLLGNVTAFLIVQFQLNTLNLIISFIYLALAIGYIGYGFVRKFAYIRRFGLGLTLFSTAKLFIYDLSFLESTGRIIAYFGFGLILLAISFIYQKVKNNMEGNHDSRAV